MAREKLTQTIFVRVEHEDPPFLIANTTLAGIGEGLDDGDTVEVAEYKRVRFFKVRRGTVEVK
jgi:hypothetical protein